MIICHPLKLIFLKTKKTAGTSFEIALSSYCGPQCVITPITPQDEVTRLRLGYRGVQNADTPMFPDGTRSNATFYNHMPAAQVRAAVPDAIWQGYRKVSITRDPFDAAISRYYWEGGPGTGLDFETFVDAYRVFLSENARIAPLDGPDAPEVVLRYEDLETTVRALGIDGLWDRFHAVRAKSGLRPDQARPAALYARFPRAAKIVARECADELRHFGYVPPAASAQAAPAATAPQPKLVFTLSAGRTGTAWLAKFLAANLDLPAIHEPTRIDDFGTQMPDIRVMRSFNTYGCDRTVREFWRTKLSEIPRPYIETNHTLGKCGLIEGLVDNGCAADATIIILRRDRVNQCASYILRGDFQNITMDWQWYLSEQYRNVLVNPKPFEPLAHIGTAIWYCFEMEARYAYYKLKYGDRLRFLDARIEDLSTPAGAAKLLHSLGHDRPPILPAPENESLRDTNTRDDTRREIAQLLGRYTFDPVAVARDYLQAGRDLAVPPPLG